MFVMALILCCFLLSGCVLNEIGNEKAQESMAVESDKISENEDQAEENDTGENKEKSKDAETLRFIDAWGEWHDMAVNAKIEKQDYNWSCLKNTETGIQYVGDERYVIRKGVDVSRHQGAIDWERVKADGYEFAILRIGYREYGEKGNLHVDEMFHENIAGAQQAGLDVGVYIFSQALNEDETLEEAELVLENLKEYDLELPVVYDPERIRDDDARTDDMTGEQFTRNTVVFCEKMKEAGYQPMIYSNLVWEAFEFNMEDLKNYPIWYADYEPVPQTPYYFTFWQYSENGQVDGIDGIVDVNVQFMESN